MVVILVVRFSLARLEQEVTSTHFKHSASETPNIGGSIILRANNYFRRTILTRLNFRSKVLIGPAAITHVADFDLHILSESRSTLHSGIVFSIRLHRLLCFFSGGVKETVDDLVHYLIAVLGSSLLLLGHFLGLQTNIHVDVQVQVVLLRLFTLFILRNIELTSHATLLSLLAFAGLLFPEVLLLFSSHAFHSFLHVNLWLSILLLGCLFRGTLSGGVGGESASHFHV